MENNKLHIDEVILAQFLLGETTAHQTEQVMQWLLESAQNQKMLDQLETLWAESGKLTPTPVAVDVQQAWDLVSEKVDSYSQHQNAKIIPIVKTNWFRMISGAAAVLIVGLAIFRIVFGPLFPAQTRTLVSTDTMIKTFLPDGSVVALNSNSQISFPEKFDKKNRAVILEGEGFFKVQPNPKQPFIIQAGGAFVKVLGTSFSVKAHRGSDVEIAVATGLVELYRIDSITGDTASVQLASGQKGILPHASGIPKLLDQPMAPDDLFWADQTLIFKKTKLSTVFEVLTKHYQVLVKVSNPGVLDCLYTASFTGNSIDEILSLIAITYKFEMVHYDTIYELKGNGCLDE